MKAKQISRIGAVVLSIIFLLSTSCNFIDLVMPQENKSESEGGTEPNTDESSEDSSIEEDDALVGCFDVKAYNLYVDHTLTITEAETELTHILQYGGIALTTSFDAADVDCALSTVAPQTIPYEYMGVVGPCSVDAQGEVILSAEGYCTDGIVYLTITEDWQETSGVMTCDGEKVNFPIAGYTAVHSGPDGNGEEFLITKDDAGFTVMREFQGGEGYHSWTLLYDIELVPLAPEDD